MAQIKFGKYIAPKAAGNSATSPLPDWGAGTANHETGGFQKQGYKYIWSGCTDSATRVKWGDTNASYNFSSNCKSGHVIVDDHYGTTDSSHNVLFSFNWKPYSFGVDGISFDYIAYNSAAHWGFGKMFLFYRYQGTGSGIAREIQPVTGCKNGNDAAITFHRSNTDKYSQVTGYQQHSFSTRAHMVCRGSRPSDDYKCVGFGGFYTIDKHANVDKNHGFIFDNLYLLAPYNSGKDWIGGKCSSYNTTKGRIYTV